MKRLFNDEEARRTVAKLYLPGIEKCLQYLTELKADFEKVAGEQVLDLDTGQHVIKKRVYTKPHWTQTPEGRAKLSRMGKKYGKRTLVKARAAMQEARLAKRDIRSGGHMDNVLTILKKNSLKTGDLIREANIANQHSVLSKMKNRGLIRKNEQNLWEAVNA